MIHFGLQDQQQLLELCPPQLLQLSATLVPTLVPVLERMTRLRHLFLHPARCSTVSRQTLEKVLSLGNLQRTLLQLEVCLKTGRDTRECISWSAWHNSVNPKLSCWGIKYCRFWEILGQKPLTFTTTTSAAQTSALKFVRFIQILVKGCFENRHATIKSSGAFSWSCGGRE